MLNFSQNPYTTLERVHGTAGAGGAAGAPGGDPEAGHASGAPRMASSSGGIGTDGGRVQMPIGMVGSSQSVRSSQSLALGLFTAVNVLVLLALFALSVLLAGWLRVLVVLLGGGAWLALLLFNLRLAGRPRRVLQTFLHQKPPTRLGRRLPHGQTVVVRGAVSLLNEELLSTEFHSVPGLVLVESSLRSYHGGGGGTRGKSDAWTEHVRQTRAVDFRLTDPHTGMSAVVKAFAAAEAGLASPLVHVSTEVPLSTAPPGPPGGPGAPGGAPGAKGADAAEEAARKRRRALAAPQLMVCKGYIRQGQVVTVMGVLAEDPATHELLIEPLPAPHNVAKLLLLRRCLPFFFPTWANGLVISDQRDLA